MAYYNRDEQETHYSFSPIDGFWRIESSYGPHIRTMLERCEIIATIKDEQGRVILATGQANKNQIRLFKPR